jgi:hypothetical protein
MRHSISLTTVERVRWRHRTPGARVAASIVSIVLVMSGVSTLPSGADATATPRQAPPDEPSQWQPSDSAAQAPSGATSYTALRACRLLDTRPGAPDAEIDTAQVDDRTLRLSVDGCAIPNDATAVLATTTIVRPARTGWLVAYPTGTSTPTAATLNWAAGATRGNTTAITVGDDRLVDVRRSDGFGAGDLVIDVVGAFVPATGATRGRLVPVEAMRLLDTRERATGRLDADASTRIPLPDGVPADADAVAITVTAIDPTRRAFVTAYGAGTDRPNASMLNVDVAGQFRSSSTIVPVTSDGFEVFASSDMHLTVDLTGWFTGPSAAESIDGLFVPVAPRRLRDTRPETHPIHERGTIEVAVPDTPAAVMTSMTLISPDERGFLTAHAARTERPTTASGYAMRNETTAQFSITPASTTGLAVYSERGTDLTVDLLGWFTGAPVDETLDTAPPNPVRFPRVIAIGDSTMAGVRWYRTQGALTGASWTFDGESCRRLVRASCRGREGRVPSTVLERLTVTPDVFDVLVVMTGYNDVASTFAADVEQVMAAARAKHIRRVVWLTYSREFATDRGATGAPQIYAFHNALLREAGERFDDLEVVEWSTVARQRPTWLHADGIHFTNEGSFGNADFMSRAVAHVTGQPCPVGPADDPVCPDPGRVDIPDVRSRYGIVDTTLQCWEVGPTREPVCLTDPYAT